MHDRRWKVIDGDDFANERSREIELMLTAIARAIAAGRLPPDDAYAWARIAASIVRADRMSERAAFGPSIGLTTH